MIYFNKT